MSYKVATKIIFAVNIILLLLATNTLLFSQFNALRKEPVVATEKGISALHIAHGIVERISQQKLSL